MDKYFRVTLKYTQKVKKNNGIWCHFKSRQLNTKMTISGIWFQYSQCNLGSPAVLAKCQQLDSYCNSMILAIITSDGVLYFWKGWGCLDMALRICRNTLFSKPPWLIILLYTALALGMKSDKRSVQRAILRNSDMMDP